jgi:hypothetical protein
MGVPEEAVGASGAAGYVCSIDPLAGFALAKGKVPNGRGGPKFSTGSEV